VQWTPQGQVSSMQYPSGRVISTSFDGAGRPSGVSGVLSGNPTTYASGISYAPQGSVASLLSVGLDYNPTQNNGTLRIQTITRPGLSARQTYTYDGANRLQAAVENSGWSQSYVYDKIGNRAVTGNRSIPLANYTPQSPDGVTVPLMAQITCTERDSETGLDYFGAWYFGSALGRFTSPDPISGTMLHILHGRRCGMAGNVKRAVWLKAVHAGCSQWIQRDTSFA
jgi:YD repeat-containing protein